MSALLRIFSVFVCTFFFVIAGSDSRSAASAAIVFTDDSLTYSQNFDSLVNTFIVGPWVNNAESTDTYGLPGWFAAYGVAGATVEITGSNGGTTVGRMLSLGATGVSERALGAINQDATGAIFYGVKFLNGLNTAIDSFTARMDGEQWRRSSAATAQAIFAEYRVFGAGEGSIDAAGTWSPLSDMTFTSPIFDGTAGSLDGNAAANRVEGLTQTIGGLTVLPGEELWFRIRDPNHPGLDHIMGIDNFSFSVTAVPEPSTALTGLLCIIAGIAKRGRSRRRLRLNIL